MDKKVKIIYDFLTNHEGFYMDQYESIQDNSLNWISLRQFPKGLYAIVITNDDNVINDEASAIRYLNQKNIPYSLHIVVLSKKHEDFRNIVSSKIVIDETTNKVLYADEDIASLAEVFSQIISPKPKKEKYRGMELTISLIAINIVIYIISAIKSGNIMDIDSMTLFRMGAKFGPAIDHGQVWRLFTAAFLHGGIMHLACNMYSLYIAGSQIEQIYGKVKYIIIYVLSALGSSLLSYILAPRTLSVGASGAIFGLLGALLVFAIKNRNILSKGAVFNLLSVIVLNLYIGLTSTSIDNFGHIGGLIVGIIVSIILNIL